MIEKILERLEEEKEAYSDTTYYVYGVEAAIKIVQEVAKDDGWIPCSERLPSKEEFLKNDGRFIVTDGNRVYQSTYDIYEQCFKTMKMHAIIDMGYRSSFEVDNCVIEWMPFPPYQKGE